MDIIYLGHSCFLIRAKKARLVTDPYGGSVGFIQAKTKADIVTVSHNHSDHYDLSRIEGESMEIKGPGEYEIKGVSVFGRKTFHDKERGAKRGKNTVYVIQIGDIRICHLGDLGHKLSQKQLDWLDGVDVLMIPVGGFYTIGPEEAWEIIKEINPSIVLPMHYRAKGMKESFDKLASLEDFMKAIDTELPRKEKKLSLKKLELPEETEIVILERKE